MTNDFFNYSAQAARLREIEANKTAKIEQLIKLLQDSQNCPKCRSMDANARITQEQIGQDKQDLREIRLACMKVFKFEGFERIQAIKALYMVMESIYGKRTIYGWNIKQADQQAFNAYMAEQRRCKEATDLLTAHCASIKAALPPR